MARTMLTSARRITLSAISSTDTPNRPASGRNTRRAASRSTSMRPPRNASGRRVPRTRCASVTVGRFAAPPVAGRSRRRAGRARADPEQAPVVGPGDGAAAGPDGDDVDDRGLHRQAVDPGHRRQLGLAAGNERDVGAGTAHVEGDEVVVSGAGDTAYRADHAGRGAREEGRDGVPRHRFGRHPPAIGLHDAEPPGEAATAKGGGEPADVAGHDRLHVGGEHGGRGALVFPELPGHVVRTGHRERRGDLANDACDHPFVVRVGVGMQEAESRRLVASFREHPPDQTGDRGAIRAPDDRAVGRDALVDLDDVPAGHDRFGLGVAKVVDRVLVVPLEQQHVADALRDEEADRGALAFEDRIGRHRRAVDELLDRSRVEAGRVDRPHGPLVGRCRRARHFRRAHGRPVHRHQVGERPAYLDADPHASLPRRA